MLENGLEDAREISAPYVESGWEMTADFVTKTKELSVADLVVKTSEISVNMRDVGVEIGKKVGNSVVEYSEVAKDSGMEAVNSALEYSAPFIQSGKNVFEEAIEKGKALFESEENNSNGSIRSILLAISSIIIITVLVGLTTVSLLSRRDQELHLSKVEEGNDDYETVEEEGVKDDGKEEEREDDDEAMEEEGVTDDDEDEEG